MSKQAASPYFMACISHAIEHNWDNVWAPRLAGFPVNVVYAAASEWVGLAHATYVFDPGTFVAGAHSRQMLYRSTVDSKFSVLIVLHTEGGLETFKYRGSELICEASGPDFRTAMNHATACGLALDEPIDNPDSATQPGDQRTQRRRGKTAQLASPVVEGSSSLRGDSVRFLVAESRLYFSVVGD